MRFPLPRFARLLPASVPPLLAFAPGPARAIDPADPAPALILSEILADPAALPDAQGEFLELGAPRADSVFLDSVAVSVDGQKLFLGALALGPGACFLICRDSAAYARSGIACARGWGGMSLANTRSLQAEAAWAGGSFRASVPPARPGASWENTWDPSAGYSAFLPARAAGAGGDSATPGARNSRGIGPAGRDLALAAIEASGSNLCVTVEDRGSAPPPPSALGLRLDADWDGIAETPLDSLPLEADGTFPRVIRFRLPPDARGRLEAALRPEGGADADPGNDALSLSLEPDGGPLAFGACQPAGGAGEPEWVEIRNATAERGGAGRRISLAAATVGGMPAGPAGSLAPGERAVLTADTAAFRARHGALKAKVMRPERWRALRNSGDTLVLALAGLPADTLAWGPVGGDGAAIAGGAGAPEAAGWSLSGRTAFPDAPLEIEVRSPPGMGYVLRAFDLEGACAREIGRGGPGRRTHAWDGRGEGGRRLPFGAYVLCLAFEGGGARKRAVAAGER